MAGRRARAVRPQRRPDPEPMEVDESLVIAIGSGLWFIAWMVLFISHNQLEDNGNEWYLWTAAAGLGLGVWGWWLVRKRVEARPAGRRRGRGTPEPTPEPTPQPTPQPTPESAPETPATGTGRRRRRAG